MLRYLALSCALLAGLAWGEDKPLVCSKPGEIWKCVPHPPPTPRHMPQLSLAVADALKELQQRKVFPSDLQMTACGGQTMDASVAPMCLDEFEVADQWPPAGTRLKHGKASVHLRLVRKLPAAPYDLASSQCADPWRWKPEPVRLGADATPGTTLHTLAPRFDGMACRKLEVTVVEPAPPQPPPQPPTPDPPFPTAPAVVLGGLGGAALMRLLRGPSSAVATAAAAPTPSSPVPAMRVHLDHPG